jgi:hypothetical protein
MVLYARWLVSFHGSELARPAGEGVRGSYTPNNAARVAAATRFAHRRVDRERVTLLERRAEFRDYFEKLRSDAVFHAKELANEDLVENFEIRRAGLRKAAGRKEDPETGEVTYEVADVKAIEHYTRPYLELAHPKKPLPEGTVPRIVINIGSGSPEAKRLWGKVLNEKEELDEISYEVIETKLLEDGDDD